MFVAPIIFGKEVAVPYRWNLRIHQQLYEIPTFNTFIVIKCENGRHSGLGSDRAGLVGSGRAVSLLESLQSLKMSRNDL